MGKLTFSNESSLRVYDGGFENGRMEGVGTLEFKNGEIFVGVFVNDTRNGFGIQTYPENSTRISYEGNFVDDAFEGDGNLTMADGEIYSGQWRNNLKHGLGVLQVSMLF